MNKTETKITILVISQEEIYFITSFESLNQLTEIYFSRTNPI
jgi:hypothetical protein